MGRCIESFHERDQKIRVLELCRIRPYSGKPMVNKPWIPPVISGEGTEGTLVGGVG